MKDRVHNFLLSLIGVGIGLYALTTLGGAFFGDATGFAKLTGVLYGLFTAVVALGFLKRRGWAFLVVSVGLLGGWLYEMVMGIVVYSNDQSPMVHVVCFTLITVLIGYLGRWPMERRFRPHLDH